MQPNVYRFLINSVEVFPHYKTLQKKYSLENSQKFFRVDLEGELKLYGADYFLIKDSSIFAEFTLIIQQKVNGAWRDYYEGSFSKTDCEINIDKREVKIKLSPKDQYSAIMDNYSNEYNLTDLAPALTPVLISKRPILQVYTYEDNIINNFLASGATWEQEVSLGDMTITDLYKQHFAPLIGGNILTEVQIATGGPYDGTYTGNSITLISPTNLGYTIVGGVTPSTEEVTYNFTVYSSSDTQLALPLYRTGVVTANSKYTSLKFINPNNANDYFMAEVITHFIFTRILSGFSVTHNGEVAAGELASGDFGYIDGYSYAYPALGCASLYLTVANSSEPTSYGKADNDLYYTPPTIPLNTHFYPFSKSTWDATSKWLTFTDKFVNQYDTYATTYAEIKDCISIASVISALLKKVSPNLKHEATPEYSSFLYSDTNPVYGDKLNLFITQKTNVLSFIYDEPAKKVPITFESLMNMLKKCFNCYWFIEDDKFKIEHASYFKNGRSYNASIDESKIGLDITKLYDNRNGKPLGLGQSIIGFDKEKLPARYEFSYMDDTSIEFEGPAIKLTAPYLQQNKVESIAVESFNADIDTMLSNPGGVSKEGFALIAATYIKNEEDSYDFYSTFLWPLKLYDDRGVEYEVKLQNGVLSWLYLANFYFTDMPAAVAEYEGFPKVPIRITGIKACMTQDISIPVEEDPDLYKLITTGIGNGQISSMSIDITTKQAKITLVYEPE